MIRAFFVTIFLIGLGLLGYAGWIEPRQLHIRISEIGSGDRSVRIALMSDLHVGGFHVSPERVAEIVRRINAQSPDLVLMPGDFIDGHKPRAQMDAKQKAVIADGMAYLETLNAPAIATLGNHDTWHGRASVRRMLTAAGVRVIDNDAVLMDGLCIVGLADHDTDQPTDAGFASCSEIQPIIALMHSPDSRGLLPPRTALAVAGHTHGGQINLPIIDRRVTSTRCGQPCAYGLIQSDPPVFVSAGIGTSILPIRFRSPPEIIVITLHIPAATAGIEVLPLPEAEGF